VENNKGKGSTETRTQIKKKNERRSVEKMRKIKC
jgi:hypothetical protein